jgi:Mce-associated membrane protein
VTADKDAPDVDVTDGDVVDVDEPSSAATEAVEADAIEADAIETPAPPKQKRAVFSRVRRGAGRHWAAIALTMALVASAGLAAWMFFFVYKPDRAGNEAAMQSAEKAAADGTVALLSYSPDSLDKDFATAKSKLTGSFLSYYTQFTEQIVAPAAKQKAVKTQAAVVRKAVSEIHPDSAVVLVFINQTTESKDRPDASFINSAVRVTLQKIDGGWLISSFDPV